MFVGKQNKKNTKIKNTLLIKALQKSKFPEVAFYWSSGTLEKLFPRVNSMGAAKF